MANVNFYYGTKANFDAIDTKDSNTLYFITDTLQLYKGEDEYTKSTTFVTSLPGGNEARQGVIYITAGDLAAYRYTGSAYQKINLGHATQISDVHLTDDEVPTTKAVADYVAAKIAAAEAASGSVTGIEYGDGSIIVSRGSSNDTVTLNGVAHEPSYDSESGVLTIPVYGSSDFQINIAALSTIQGGYYDSETDSIILTLASGDTVSIPIGSLVDIYVGAATPTAETVISSDNKITVNVKVSAKANNSIVIEEDGLYVPIPDAYTKAQIDNKLTAITNTLDAHRGDTDIHITETERASWNAKASLQQIVIAKGEAISAAADDATLKANQALQDAKSYTDGTYNSMNTRVSVLEQAVEWHKITE